MTARALQYSQTSDDGNAKATMQVASAPRHHVGLLSQGRLIIMNSNQKTSVLAIKSNLKAGTLNPHAWAHAPQVAIPTNMILERGARPFHKG